MESPQYDQVTVRLGRGQRPQLMRVASALGSKKITLPIKIVIEELIEETTSDEGLAAFIERAALRQTTALLAKEANSPAPAKSAAAEHLMDILRDAMEKVAEEVVTRRARHKGPRGKVEAQKPKPPGSKA